jgi:hypothetical protein
MLLATKSDSIKYIHFMVNNDHGLASLTFFKVINFAKKHLIPE